MTFDSPVLPLGALMAGACMAGSAWAQAADTAAATGADGAQRVTITGEALRDRDTLRATKSRIGKGEQRLADIPQSLTVVTEKLIDDKQLDTVKGALHYAVGISFEAGEGGGIGDLVRLRGFSARGDMYIDGIRDIAQYNRDTFNTERVEVLRGSASMLFGRGSTGGVINQASKQAWLANRHEVTATVGSDHHVRLTGDFNLVTGGDQALRVNVMRTEADSFRNGPSTDRTGAAFNYGWGIGTRDEFRIGAFHLQYRDVPDYGFRWWFGRPVDAAVDRWYGTAGDYQNDRASYVDLRHIHRFDDGSEWRTTYRDGQYRRDLWATTAGFASVPVDPAVPAACSYPAGTATRPYASIADSNLICRGNQTRAASDHHRILQTDWNGKLQALGMRHDVIAGAELADERTTTYAYGSVPAKPPTTWGQPGGTAAVVDTRVRTPQVHFTARTIGVYAQDTAQIAPHWKLVAGVRYDRFEADYHNVAVAPTVSWSRTDGLWSKRLGVLFQPDAQSSYYASWGTSFNTTGDLYQFGVTGNTDAARQLSARRSANTPPEESRNFEVGAKWDLLDGRLSLRTAVFRSEKTNERNTDVTSADEAFLLSGKRHTDGVEVEAAGRVGDTIEVFGGLAWMKGRIDAAGSEGPASVGQEPGLTPRLTGNLWATWRIAPRWRAGFGVDGRSQSKPASTTSPNRAPGYVKADAMLEYLLDAVTLQVNLNNVFDKVYADGLYNGFTVPGPTRQVFLTMKAAF